LRAWEACVAGCSHSYRMRSYLICYQFIHLFIILLVQTANKMGSQKKLNFCGRKSTTRCICITWRWSNGPKHVVTNRNEKNDHKTVTKDGVCSKLFTHISHGMQSLKVTLWSWTLLERQPIVKSIDKEWGRVREKKVWGGGSERHYRLEGGVTET
jgi:hypothetical protein